MEDKRIIILQVDGTNEELMQIRGLIEKFQPQIPNYKFLLVSKTVSSISKEEFAYLLQQLREFNGT